VAHVLVFIEKRTHLKTKINLYEKSCINNLIIISTKIILKVFIILYYRQIKLIIYPMNIK